MHNSISRDEAMRPDPADLASDERLANVTPGDVLRSEFLVPMHLSARQLAREIGVPANRITGILAGDRAVSAETALLFSERFGTSPEFWMNLQSAFDLEEARRRREGRSAAGGDRRFGGSPG